MFEISSLCEKVMTWPGLCILAIPKYPLSGVQINSKWRKASKGGYSAPDRVWCSLGSMQVPEEMKRSIGLVITVDGLSQRGYVKGGEIFKAMAI